MMHTALQKNPEVDGNRPPGPEVHPVPPQPEIAPDTAPEPEMPNTAPAPTVPPEPPGPDAPSVPRSPDEPVPAHAAAPVSCEMPSFLSAQG